MIFRDKCQPLILKSLLFKIMLACLLVVVGGLVLPGELRADAAQAGIIEVVDLSQDAGLARAQDLVLLIEFSSDSCAYCRLLEAEFLNPMLRNSDYDNKVIIRSLNIDRDRSLNDFQGKSVSVSELIAKYEIEVTPTMLFLDARGRELSERLVGIWSLDYFGGYIDERIDSARARLF